MTRKMLDREVEGAITELWDLIGPGRLRFHFFGWISLD